MAIATIPSEEECYLLAILSDPSGIDIAEFALRNPSSSDGLYRVRDYQWSWFANTEKYQVDQGARSTGKTESIKLRCLAFPFSYPGKGMLITAPELNHLRPLTDEVEKFILGTRLAREMLPDGKGSGITRSPHWQVQFKNGSSIVSRLPNKDGKGVKGQHVVNIEMDECFPAGTLVTTRRGQVPIEQVVVGDEVITHKNRYRKVTDTMTRERPTVTIKGQGHPGFRCSTNHKFWALTEELAYLKVGDEESNRVQRHTVHTGPKFVPAVDMLGNSWCSPLTWPKVKIVPALGGAGRRKDLDPPIVDVNDNEFMWLVGLYLAEGSYWSDGSRDMLHLSIHENEVDEVKRRAEKVGLNFSGPHYPVKDSLGVNMTLYGSKTCNLRELGEWFDRHFGKGAHNKKIPTWALGLPKWKREALLEGLIYGDGYWFDGDATYAPFMKLTTVSHSLAVSARLLGLSLGYSVSIHWCDTSKRECYIRGRRITSNGFYQVVFRDKGHGMILENRRYTKVKSVEPTGEVETLYDLTVEEDHTFIANGYICSNSQDYPPAGWTEIVECLNADDPDSTWRCHGVSRGVRDSFFEKTQPGSGWKVHRPLAMMRPGWSKEERDAKIVEYGGSRQAIDYKRNIYGEHGDASSAVFVMHKLMKTVDTDEYSRYNTDIYKPIKFVFENLPEELKDKSRIEERQAHLSSFLQVPGEHFSGYSQKVTVDRRTIEVGAPGGYSAYFGGQDVGVTSHPSEILVFGQRVGTDFLELLMRVHMQRINTADQKFVVAQLFELYGPTFVFGIDKTGVGFPLWDELTQAPFGDRVHGFNFSEKRVVAIEDRDLKEGETEDDLIRMRNVVEASTDWMRNLYIDAQNFRLPYDREVIREFQGQTVTTIRDSGDPYGVKKMYGGGSFHSLDAAKVAVAAKHIPPLEELVRNRVPKQEEVVDVFVGSYY